MYCTCLFLTVITVAARYFKILLNSLFSGIGDQIQYTILINLLLFLQGTRI